MCVPRGGDVWMSFKEKCYIPGCLQAWGFRNSSLVLLSFSFYFRACTLYIQCELLSPRSSKVSRRRGLWSAISLIERVMARSRRCCLQDITDAFSCVVHSGVVGALLLFDSQQLNCSAASSSLMHQNLDIFDKSAVIIAFWSPSVS